MNVNHHQAKRDRSYFEWSDKMQIICKGNGDIAMTEGELVDFFGVTWRKLNYHLQLLLKTSHLHPDERDAGEEEVFVNGQPRGYAPLYPLPIIIALSFHSWTAWKLICSESTFAGKYTAQQTSSHRYS